MNFSTLSCLLVVPHDWLLLVDFYNIKQSFYSSMARSLSKHSFRDQEAPWLNNLHDMYKHWTFFFFSLFCIKLTMKVHQIEKVLNLTSFTGCVKLFFLFFFQGTSASTICNSPWRNLSLKIK